MNVVRSTPKSRGNEVLAQTRSFKGFDARASALLDELAANNNLDWFNSNKHLFDVLIRSPAEALRADLCSRLRANAVTNVYSRILAGRRSQKHGPRYMTKVTLVLEMYRMGSTVISIKADVTTIRIGFHDMPPFGVDMLKTKEAEFWQGMEQRMSTHGLVMRSGTGLHETIRVIPPQTYGQTLYAETSVPTRIFTDPGVVDWLTSLVLAADPFLRCADELLALRRRPEPLPVRSAEEESDYKRKLDLLEQRKAARAYDLRTDPRSNVRPRSLIYD